MVRLRPSANHTHVGRFGLALVACALAGLTALHAGCERNAPPSPYEALSGVVTARDANTGEITLHVTGQQPGRHDTDRTIACIVTRDSEIYIDDQLRPVSAVQAGDAAEIIGRREPGRFAVSTVYIQREAGPAPQASWNLPSTASAPVQ
jgi:hypothetical protein